MRDFASVDLYHLFYSMSNDHADDLIYQFDRRPEVKGVTAIISGFGEDNAVATKDEYACIGQECLIANTNRFEVF